MLLVIGANTQLDELRVHIRPALGLVEIVEIVGLVELVGLLG
jgi:hypothetical protein